MPGISLALLVFPRNAGNPREPSIPRWVCEAVEDNLLGIAAICEQSRESTGLGVRRPGPYLGSPSDSFCGLVVPSGLQLDWILVPALTRPSLVALCQRFTPPGLTILVCRMGVTEAPTSWVGAEDD